MGHDNTWWWEMANQDKLGIQRCLDCQALRHPPRPMCGECQSTSWDFIHSTGEGTIFSFVVVRHPEVPGYTYPLVVAVIDLAEGTRYVGNVVDVAAEDVKIGMKVLASVELVDDEMMLPVFRPA
jgi:uncharacterized OB-fold protein